MGAGVVMVLWMLPVGAGRALTALLHYLVVLHSVMSFMVWMAPFDDRGAKAGSECTGVNASSNVTAPNSHTKMGAGRVDRGEWLTVASRTIIWSLVKQMRVCLIPLFHGLHRRTALER